MTMTHQYLSIKETDNNSYTKLKLQKMTFHTGDKCSLYLLILPKHGKQKKIDMNNVVI
jgi:hypothetical protein